MAVLLSSIGGIEATVRLLVSVAYVFEQLRLVAGCDSVLEPVLLDLLLMVLELLGVAALRRKLILVLDANRRACLVR